MVSHLFPRVQGQKLPLERGAYPGGRHSYLLCFQSLLLFRGDVLRVSFPSGLRAALGPRGRPRPDTRLAHRGVTVGLLG